MKVGIIGCGLIGRKRAIALNPNDELVACCDTNAEILERFSKEFNCISFSNHFDLLKNSGCEIVVVAVVNKYIKEIVISALNFGKHVLAEKPLGRNVQEASEMVETSFKNGLLFKTGFNHRFHPAIWKAKEIFDKGRIGTLLMIRARYGHGGRPGMEKEWRASKELCGGGELLDQGVHIIDLSRWFAGEIKTVFGKTKTNFWNMGVEDNAFVLMESEKGADIQFQVSWTNWRNIFSFEIFGEKGYLKVEGLGGSYGPETLEFGLRKKQGGKPDIEIFQFPEKDISWEKEWEEFKNAIEEKRVPIGNGKDGLKANQIIEAIYKSSNVGKIVKL